MKSFLHTTRTISPRSSNRRARRVLVFVVVVFACVVFAKPLLSSLASLVTIPFYTITEYMRYSSASVPVFLRERAALNEELRTLENRIAAQQGMTATLAHMTAENAELRAMLQATGTPKIAAGVIARPPYTPYDTLILDRGSAAGIREDTPVFYGDGMVIGYVRSVTPDHAFVTLLSSPGVTATVYVFGPDLFVSAQGEGGGVIRLSIPQGITVAEGDAVILPSLDGGAVGLIDVVESTPTGPEQHAFVTLGAPIASLRLVTVGTTPITPIDFFEAQAVVDERTRALFSFPVPEDIQPATSTPTTTP